MSANSAIQQATEAANVLRTASSEQRTAAIQAMAEQLLKQQDAILEANTLDLETSREMAISNRLLEWLKLTPERLQKVIDDLLTLSRLPDPIGRVVATSQPSVHGQTFTELLPLGVIAFVHESLPDLAAIAAGLCMRSGNSLLLRGSQEARQTNLAIFQVLQSAIIETDLPADSLIDLAAQEDYSLRDFFCTEHQPNLVIPYGRPSWVQQTVRQCNAPILQTAIGNCYLYWSASGSLEKVRNAILDSHRTQPDAVNGIEKVLVHPQLKQSSLGMLWNSLRENGFEIRGDEHFVNEFPDLTLVEPSEWRQSYLQKTVAFKLVDRLEDAAAWMNQYSSGHANCIVTDSYTKSQKFAQQVNSTFIYINESPRFHRLDPGEKQVFLGISKQKGSHRGAIGVESLMTTKQIILGNCST
ncbi:glutamate-5-semialdehyde dehydrogenase [Romeriopsis navalis]|uniref:glutamate-5-semialdehyde dehydrogenase n=1 Tax=Romeriopsis navalis TaxID=2992132 RepID=UPI0021F8164F|nr:glutamate-5-semialdehyde dehydrogenase [Romeriopsis navalis]